MNRLTYLKISGLTGLLFLMFITGCAATHQMREAKKSGFLGDYSMLREGKDEEALLVYIHPEINFNRYKKVILEPVRLIASEGSDMAKVDPEDAKRMADYFYTVIYQSLQQDYQMVNEPGPNTMRIRVALTDTTGSKVALDTVGTILPIGLALSTINMVATGTHLAVGKAGGEIEIMDAETGMRLGAAVDARAGRKITGRLDKFEKWNDVKGACDYWAERIRLRLEELSDAGYILHGVE
jgi:hypothetical protein